MRESLPIPRRTASISAPIKPHKLAMSFIKDIRVANILLEAYLIISALAMSHTCMRSPDSMNGLYKALMILPACSSSTPTTTRSGLMKSSMAVPSFRNSGLLATPKAISTPLLSSSRRITSRTFSAVPTGTVLLVTSSV